MALGGLDAEQVREADEELPGLRELFLLRPFRKIAGDGDDVRLELEVAFQSGQVFTQAGEEHVVGEVATGAAPRVESPEDMVLPKLRVREVQECDGVTGHGPDDSGASRALAMRRWQGKAKGAGEGRGKGVLGKGMGFRFPFPRPHSLAPNSLAYCAHGAP